MYNLMQSKSCHEFYFDKVRISHEGDNSTKCLIFRSQLVLESSLKCIIVRGVCNVSATTFT